MEDTSTKKNHLLKKELLFIVLLMVIAVVLIVIGLTISKYSKPKYIYEKTINEIYDYTKNIITYDKKDTDLGENISLESLITLNINSDQDIFNTGYDLKTLYRYYNNLSRTKTKLTFKQDISNKKLLFNVDSKINNYNLTNHSYLVDNSTKYEYLYGFKDNYINLGNARYYETISKNKNISYNLNYLSNFIKDSIIKNINKNDITLSKEKTVINDNEVKLLKYEYKLDDMKLRLLINGVIKDLKANERTNNIMNIINPNFSKYKISDKKRLLDKHENIIFSIYTNNLYKVKKVVFTKEDSTIKKDISFEPKEDIIEIKTYSNSKETSTTTLKKVRNTYIASIVDDKQQTIGSIEIYNEEKRSTMIVTISNNDKKIDINLDRNITKLNEKVNYNSNISLQISILDKINMNKILNLNIFTMNKVSKYVKIEVGMNNIILLDSLTKEEKAYKDLEKERIKNKLLR